jgi:aspartate aminotransferase
MTQVHYLNPRYQQGSPTLNYAAKVSALRAEGRDILEMVLGELQPPFFEVPAHIKAAMHEAIDANRTRYTDPQGEQEVLEVIRAKLERDYKISYSPREVMLSNGVKQVIENLFAVALEPGDEVLIPAPCWVYKPNITKYGGVCKFVPCSKDNNYNVIAKQLEDAITQQTKWLIINSPTNPTGSLYTREDFVQIAKVLRKNTHVRIFLDEIYEQLVFDGHEFCSLLTVAPDLKDRVVVANGISKVYAGTGLRGGFASGSEETIFAMTNHQSITTSSICTPVQWAMKAAFGGNHDFLEAWMAELQDRRDAFVCGINQQVRGLHAISPMSTFYVRIECGDWTELITKDGKTTFETDLDVANHLVEKAGVAMMFGAPFNYQEPMLRGSLNLPKSELEIACERIAAARNELVTR